MIQGLQPHEACLIFPLLKADDLEHLRNSLRSGFDARHPIILYEGKILDGRHRYQLCVEEGIEATFEDFKGGDPYLFAWQENGALRSYENEIQKGFCLKITLAKSDEWTSIQRKTQEEANRKRSEAAILQHEKSNPRIGERLVRPHIEDGPEKTQSYENEIQKGFVVRNTLAKSDEWMRERAAILENRGNREDKTVTAKARLLGLSRPTMERCDHIEKHAPELVPKIMTGEVKPADAMREIKRKIVKDKLEQISANEAVMPTGLFDVIVIDPPWPIKKIERDLYPEQVELDYPTMAIEEIKAIEIPAAENCHLWLWTTQKFLPHSFDILQQWGFKYVCTFVWQKAGGFQPIGLPQFNCEFALYARRGTPMFLDTKDFKLCFQAERGAHSEKPERFYQMVNRVTAGRRLDMFNRRTLDGFFRWGNEVKHE